MGGKTILLLTPALKCFMTVFTDQNTPVFVSQISSVACMLPWGFSSNTDPNADLYENCLKR